MIAAESPSPEFSKGDVVRINQGPFEDFKGTVDFVFEDSDLVRIMILIFDRLTPLELKTKELEKVR